MTILARWVTTSSFSDIRYSTAAGPPIAAMPLITAPTAPATKPGTEPRGPLYCQPRSMIRVMIRISAAITLRTIPGSTPIRIIVPSGVNSAVAAAIGPSSRQRACGAAFGTSWNEPTTPRPSAVATASVGDHSRARIGTITSAEPKPVKPRTIPAASTVTTASACGQVMISANRVSADTIRELSDGCELSGLTRISVRAPTHPAGPHRERAAAQARQAIASPSNA